MLSAPCTNSGSITLFPSSLAWIQEAIVSGAILAAGAGSAIGGLLSDVLGRRRALLAADALFTVGALAMAAARGVAALVVGRALVGLGIGLASVTVPVYLAEAAPPALRGRLVTWNVFFITGGQFLSYVINYLFSSLIPVSPWRWMLGVAAVPSVAQAAGLLFLPESPAWLAGRGRADEACAAMALLQPRTLCLQQQRLHASTAAEEANLAQDGVSADDGGGEGSSLLQPAARGGHKPMLAAVLSQRRSASAWSLLRSPVFLRELHVGVGLQILQQVAGM